MQVKQYYSSISKLLFEFIIDRFSLFNMYKKPSYSRNLKINATFL